MDTHSDTDIVKNTDPAEGGEIFPAKFYKYRSMSGDAEEWVERTVLHDEIYFGPASSFNDPFDLRAVVSLDATPECRRSDFLRMSRKFAPELTEEQHAIEADRVMATSFSAEEIALTTGAIQAITNHFVTTRVGVYCVSTKPDDILMWAHYADFHRGVCLVFDGTLALMAHAQKVAYRHDRAPLNPYEDSQEVMAEKALLTKSEQWKYESEWRLLWPDDGPGVVKFTPANLTGVIIGALAPPSTVEKVRSWRSRRPTPISLFRASADPNRFKINVAPLR
jgi:hypothetical protein